MDPDEPNDLSRRRWICSAALAGGAILQPKILLGKGGQLSRRVLYYGADVPPDELLEFRAGPLTMLFDPTRAYPRHLRYGERMVLLGIYAAVREKNWKTVATKVRDLEIRRRDGAFELTFQADCVDEPVEFTWRGTITGTAAGVVRFEMDGEARSTFQRNRIGLCILHPLVCAGHPCTVETPAGEKRRMCFPELISPRQPFFDVRAITHEVAPGVTAETRMEGEVFETEDQRNWTDPSYKTYGTPLARPFPVEVRKGTKIRQSVTLTLHGASGGRRPRPAASEVTVRAAGEPLALPPVGIGMAAASPPLSEMEAARLRAAYPAHLRVEFSPGEDGWRELFRRGVQESNKLGVPLEMAVVLGGDPEKELARVKERAAGLQPNVSCWLVFQSGEASTPDEVVKLARRRLTGRVGGGTLANFAELNRGRPVEPGDVVCYSVNPQMHTFDNLSMVETFAGLRDTMRTARSFAGSAKVAVTPVTMKPRFNAVARGPEARREGELPASVDVRQMSLFGAGWTLGALASLAESGADSLTCYETTGWRGLMESERGSPLPEKFPSIPGTVFPLYHVMADVGEFGGGTVIPVRISDPLSVAAMLLANRGRRRLLLANLTSETRAVRVGGARLGSGYRVWQIDEHSGVRAMEEPEVFRRDPGRGVMTAADALEIALLPYAYARIEPV